MAFNGHALRFYRNTVTERGLHRVRGDRLRSNVGANHRTAFTNSFHHIGRVRTHFFLIWRNLGFLQRTQPRFVYTMQHIRRRGTTEFWALDRLVFVSGLRLITTGGVDLKGRVDKAGQLFTRTGIEGHRTTHLFKIMGGVTLYMPQHKVASGLSVIFNHKGTTVAAGTVGRNFRFHQI